MHKAPAPRLLIIDQFEAIYTQATATERDRFIRQLPDAMNKDAIHILLTLRADFLIGRCSILRWAN
ncbi:MAG: hypothetical protein R3D55_28175 [Chloroflexota bacterium]